MRTTRNAFVHTSAARYAQGMHTILCTLTGKMHLAGQTQLWWHQATHNSAASGHPGKQDAFASYRPQKDFTKYGTAHVTNQCHCGFSRWYTANRCFPTRWALSGQKTGHNESSCPSSINEFS